MASGTRERMIEGAVRLLATRGLQGASIGEVLDATGAPRGSVYHHFPGGKDELVAAAMDLVGGRAIAALEAHRGGPPEEIAEAFLDLWRQLLLRSGCRAGCGVLAVTVAAEPGPLLDAAAAIFRDWRRALTELITAGGVGAGDAAAYATVLIAATEGAVVLSRAERDLEPFEVVAGRLVEQARALRGGMLRD